MTKYKNLCFNNKSCFILDLREKKFKNLIEGIKDLNSFKPTQNEINFFSKYKQTLLEKISNSNDDDYFNIDPQYKKALLDFSLGIYCYNKDLFLLENIINNYKKRERLTIKKLKIKFNKQSSIKKSKTTIYNLVKNKLGYSFLKTCPKTKIIEKNSSIIRGFIFITTFIKCLINGLTPIFLDESNFQMTNNKLRVWRKKEESLLFDIGKPGKRNIILGVSPEKTIYFEINKGTNNSDSFLSFFKKIINNFQSEDLGKLFFIMDNCTIHLTKKLTDFYKEKNLKIMTIVPYNSELNSVELCFRYIKQKIANKIYKNLNKINLDVKTIIESEEFNACLPKLYLETINKYFNFINKYLTKELNQD